jgi:hypothetical protein
MRIRQGPRLVPLFFVAALVVGIPALAEDITGKIKSIARSKSELVVTDEKTEKDVTVSLGALNRGLGKSDNLMDLKEEKRVTVDNVFVAAKITLEGDTKASVEQAPSAHRRLGQSIVVRFLFGNRGKEAMEPAFRPRLL